MAGFVPITDSSWLESVEAMDWMGSESVSPVLQDGEPVRCYVCAYEMDHARFLVPDGLKMSETGRGHSGRDRNKMAFRI